MPRPYAMPDINSSVDVVTYANTVSNGWLSILFVIVCTFILIINFKMRGYKTSDSFLAGLFISFILGSLLWVMGLLSGNIITIYIILIVLAGIWSVLDE